MKEHKIQVTFEVRIRAPWLNGASKSLKKILHKYNEYSETYWQLTGTWVYKIFDTEGFETQKEILLSMVRDFSNELPIENIMAFKHQKEEIVIKYEKNILSVAS